MGEPLSLRGATVLVCGARFAGQAATRVLLARGAHVLLSDRDRSGGTQALLDAGAVFLGALERLPDGVSLVVTSPGFPPHHPLLVDALAGGIEVLGEVEFAWRLRGPDAAVWLAVTGTNGKTTTVRMLESILQTAGLRALAVGNVGVSVIDAVTSTEPYDVLAVELSSYQLHWSSTITPAAGAILNLAEDHLDWHGSMDAYTSAKTKVWRSAVAVGNLDDPVLALLLDRLPGHRGFTLGEPHPGEYGVRAGMLVDARGTDLLPVADVRPAGAHNVANALAAAALAADYADAGSVARGLRDFIPDAHRNQYLLTVGGAAYVDDSKATNPHAARASMLAYQPIVWVAGGQLKGAAVDDLVAEVAPRLAGVVLLGVDRAIIADAVRRHAPEIPVIEVATDDDGAMLEVVRAAAGLARPGDTVLLAPAGASYDMFADYAARGRAFESAARELGRA
ncbi:MAG: UDP-N-acetylmuramoyl-L-alanine--D-glutamate ligase [Actinomycetota bacterium]|nr:UDP-N-acetylmuramoyl-L-alanine--D-glutamate ligase [Actinomycetota bacterium]